MENRTNAKQAIMEEFAHFHLPDGRWRMYVKPYTANLKEDLENYRKSASATSIEVTEENGTYCITSKEIIEHFCDMRNTLWFMIFWRLRCEARNTFATEIR